MYVCLYVCMYVCMYVRVCVPAGSTGCVQCQPGYYSLRNESDLASEQDAQQATQNLVQRTLFQYHLELRRGRIVKIGAQKIVNQGGQVNAHVGRPKTLHAFVIDR